MKSSRRPVLAFTLVELLVVVAIIALLAALAIPAIGGAIKRSNAAKCASNLRQIGVAYRTAIIDNNGRMFPVFSLSPTNSSNNVGCWAQKIAADFSTNPIFRCPSDPRGLSYARTNNYRSYGQNGLLLPNATDGQGVMAATIPEQTKTFLVMDVDMGYYASPTLGSHGNPTNRHGTNCNVLFVDGHVEALTVARITNAFISSGASAPPEATTNAYRWR